MTEQTASGKVNRWIAQAERAGLDVQVETAIDQGVHFAWDVIHVRISKPGALFGDSLTIVAQRYAGKAAAFRISSLRHYGMTDPTKVAPRHISSYITSLAY